MEDSLRKIVNKNFDNILDNMYDVVFIYDTNLQVKWMNDTAENKFNLDLEANKGNHCYKILYERNKPCGINECPVMQTIANGCFNEKQVKTDDGRTYVVRAYPLKNNDDKMLGVVEIAMDITKNIRLEEEVQYNKTKTRFFANLSHELKTPLNLIFSALQLLDNYQDKIASQEDRDKFDRYTDIINQNSYRLLRMVNNILDITKIDSDNFNLQLKNIDFKDLLEKILNSVKEFINSKDRELEVNIELENKLIACDPNRIERVILNLLSNAVKFTEPGDKITVSLYQDKDCNQICISVQDTGIGIKEEDREDIFQEFKQIKEGNGGSGMGLSIVKYIVEMHGGEVILNSEFGQGSEFIIKLPQRTLSDKEIVERRNVEEQLNKVKIEFSDIYD